MIGFKSRQFGKRGQKVSARRRLELLLENAVDSLQVLKRRWLSTTLFVVAITSLLAAMAFGPYFVYVARLQGQELLRFQGLPHLLWIAALAAAASAAAAHRNGR